ncbi:MULTISPECIES: homoserine dehydrogenase [Acinetobacter]|uniref:Homoserine dehydrogenase n=1 Tax=Acinetobacter pollinis TaxID=2605270 RepID=A0ABU6DV86_9GAMM|nr:MULTISPECIES: homoserine dehydrogenase [Acinetobacter]MBF7690025.1 homoserine dehydrogenase [Acinetobacter pollinis]MBF7692760.1 homoserine dehydrogenase [Acinetobacter pollinis]MBF7697771.1 homoserine dehydrogenase [Acinetobacter pollinis]MBF7700761.1 homoserine dehydrogenase [Acinetobacter pollinis]MEB5476763.1 homoserine dehydrogenase [Acinetobacter pollinis]
MKPVRLAILGLGTVGCGVLQLLQENATEIKRRTGREIQITHVGTRRPRPDLNLEGIQQSADLFEIVRQPDVDIVVELIGGIQPAHDLILEAIKHGKQVVTANKALLAEEGNELFEAADNNTVQIAYEAAVAGGIPIIKVMREGLAANRIDWLAGIINGTGNFILTEMRDKSRQFEDVLAEAQALGYAEADPTFDVEGIDAAHKLTLLASIAFGIPLQFDKVYTEGISKITAQDVKYAEELGFRIKHLGIARRAENGIELRVHPTLIPEEQPLANVNGVQNAVSVKASAVGQTMYYGPGAGGGPTASAVVADIIDLVRDISYTEDGSGTIPQLAFESLEDIQILKREEMTTAYYLRVNVDDNKGVLADITTILSQCGISIDAIMQQPRLKNRVPVVIMTDPIVESKMDEAIAKIQALPATHGEVTRIRLESLEN